MKEHFKDPIKPKVEPKGPKYDERCGEFVGVKRDWGVAHKQPVGHDGKPKRTVPTMPMSPGMYEV